MKRQRDYDGIEENKENIGRERKLVIMEHHKIDINKTKVEGICLYGGGGEVGIRTGLSASNKSCWICVSVLETIVFIFYLKC